MLTAMAMVARNEYPKNKKVVGIATEKNMNITRSFDFVLFEKDEWTEKDITRATEIQKETGIFSKNNLKYYSPH